MKNCPVCHIDYKADECPSCGWPRTAMPDRLEQTAMIDEPIHNWFELSYAQYLTIPRSVLQSMPVEWQQRFVQCLTEMDQMIDWRPQEGTYRVTLCKVEEVYNEDFGFYMEDWGHELHDPLQDYERGRRKIPYRAVMNHLNTSVVCGNCGTRRTVENGIIQRCPRCGDDETDLSVETGP